MTTRKKFKLRDLDIDRVDIVNRGANQHAHIVIAKNDPKMEDEDRAKFLAVLEEKRKKKGGRPAEVPVEMVSKNQMMGYPPQQPAPQGQPPMPNAQPPAPAPGLVNPAMPGMAPPTPGLPGSMPTPVTDRAGLAEFMAARIAAMPQQPGMPPGMIGAPPPVMPGAPPSPMGNMPQAPQPQLPMAPGIPQPGSIPPMMPMMPPQPAPPQPQAPGQLPGGELAATQGQVPGSPGGDGPPPQPPGEPGEKPKSKVPATSGDLARQLDAAKKPGLGMKDSTDPNAPPEEEDEDAERPPSDNPFADKKKASPFA